VNDSLSKLQFNQDVGACFQGLNELVQARAKAMLEQGDLSPFEAWWQASCELLAPRQISVANVDFDGACGNGEEDESIELYNNGPMLLDLGNWRINAGDEGQDMTFPHGTLIMPKTCLRIHTRRKGEFSFNSPRPIWNNKGDTAVLFDAEGNEVCAYAYGCDGHAEVSISHINYDGHEKRTEGDEYAQLSNSGAKWVELSDWQLSAGSEQNFVFPKGALLKPFSSIKVFTNKIEGSSGGYSFASHKAIWNNQGDTGVLTDHKGQKVAQYSYGDKA
jgi:hypothetical protein